MMGRMHKWKRPDRSFNEVRRRRLGRDRSTWLAGCSPRLAVLLLFVVAGNPFAADGPTTTTLYKSTGPDGKTVYSDHPPVEGREAKTLTFKNPPASPLSAATLAYIEQLRKSSDMHATGTPSGGIVLFSAAWCGYCKKAKAYLAQKGISYREVDVETKDGMLAYAQAGGKSGIPLLLANGQKVLGFSPAAYDALLTAHK
jgi:glutaredoxin